MRSPLMYATSGSDRDVELKWLAVKSVFLVTLPCGRRASCIRSLHWVFTIYRENDPYQQVCLLRISPVFRAKNQRSSDLSSFLVIPRIAHLVPRDPERFLCPVRALSLYTHRTATLHRHVKCFSTGWSHWVGNMAKVHNRSFQQMVYASCEDSIRQPPPVGISAHELRALAASWAYRRHVPLEGTLLVVQQYF